MGRLSIVVSLLLIVTVTTTFGSLIKAKNQVEEELEGLKLVEDSSGLPYYSGFSIEVIDARELTEAKLSDVLQKIGNEKRKVAVGIENQSGMTLQKPSFYVLCTTPELEPQNVYYGQALVNGIPESPETGVIGVITFYIEETATTLAVMFFVPPQEDIVGNLYNIYMYKGYRKPDVAMYLGLFHSNTYNAGVTQTKQNITNSDLKFDGFMSTPGKATLKITVHKSTST